MKPVPPPLPPQANKKPAAPSPKPNAEGVLSTPQKMSLAQIALQLRDEQVEARVVHYKEELQTSPELDRITAQVVAEFQALQNAAKGASQQAPANQDRGELEIELISSMKTMLGRLFKQSKVTSMVERKLAEMSKRFARLFFESELHERIRGAGGETKTMRYAEQALYHVLSRNEEYLVRQLGAFEYTSPRVHEEAKATLEGWTKELRNDFLAKTTPELNALVKILNEVLTKFFTEELPPSIGELSWEVVREARLAESSARAGYKIGADAFTRFRHVFEKHFLERLVSYASGGMLAMIREGSSGGASPFREETMAFLSDPHIYSDVCELVCDAVYDFLYNDGFLDLPQDWREQVRSH